MTFHVAAVRAEYQQSESWVGVPRPRLSWKTQTEQPDWMQTAAEIELDGHERFLVEGSQSRFVPWSFADLTPRQFHQVRVRTRGGDDQWSEWSDPTPLVGAFLEEGEWAASLIGLPAPDRLAQPFAARTSFEVNGPIARATLYATAHGVYQARLGGVAVDDHQMKPGWTSYQFRVNYEVTDVTALVNEGTNYCGLEVAGGWYTERAGWRPGESSLYGEQPCVAAQLVIDYVDGTQHVVLTDEHWQVNGHTDLVSSSIYDGEVVDTRLALDGWDTGQNHGPDWESPAIKECLPLPQSRLAPPVRVTQKVPVKQIITSRSGNAIIDFGQNLVGKLRVKLAGPAGTVVTIKHAEVLEQGELAMRPLRSAAATDTVILDGKDLLWEPKFTFHGFRYAEISGLENPLAPDDVQALVLHNDMERTGYFESSHPLLNQLHQNVVWGMRGNFLAVPTDCPQRDERLGWTGDIQVFAPTAAYLYDCDSFLAEWLRDLWLEQEAAQGIVPFVVPYVIADPATPAAAWGDAATVVPTVLFDCFGDRQVLAEQYPSMRAWSDNLLELAGETLLWDEGFQFGDWLDPAAPPEEPAKAQTSPDIVATAYLIRSLDLTAAAAEILGFQRDQETYTHRAEESRQAFVSAYVNTDATMSSDLTWTFLVTLADS